MARRPQKQSRVRSPEKQSERKPDEKYWATVILFADIMGASEVSTHESPSTYSALVKEFQTIFKDSCKKYLRLWPYYNKNKCYLFDARGDEGLLMIYLPEDQSEGDLGSDVDSALNIAFEIKRAWLTSNINAENRIEKGLLPIDLGIGMHLGVTTIDFIESYKHKVLNPRGAKPEGYAINLAKRIESHSREGRFTNVFLSDSAHGAWLNLPDEKLFMFDEKEVIRPKGINKAINVFEVAHHFLPTDWKELLRTSKRARTLVDATSAKPDVLARAHEMNPANVWLANEYIRAVMLAKYNEIPSDKRGDKSELKKAFSDARSTASYLANTHQRDAGILLIQGLLDGECLYFVVERQKYDQASKYSPNLAEPYWYKALSISFELLDRLEYETDKKRNELEKSDQLLLNEAFESFESAMSRVFNSAWIPYDYGCEIIRWAEDKREVNSEINKGIKLIQLAHSLLPNEVADAIERDIKRGQYLEKVKDDSRITRLLAAIVL